MRGLGVTAVVVTALALGVAQAAGLATWKIEPTANPVSGVGGLDAVSCATTTSCIAVGSTVGGQLGGKTVGKLGKSRVPLAEGWDGNNWTVEPTPDVASGGVLNDVSCTSAIACIAVGQHGGLRPTGTLAERWDGSSWTMLNPPSPPHSFLWGVSCTSATDCIAVGAKGASEYLPLVERWNGQTWAIQATPTPHGGFLYSASCTSATACMAVGYAISNIGPIPFAERLNGHRWRYLLPPFPAHGGILYGVSCTSTQVCIAAGTSPRTPTTFKPLAELWTGQKWAVKRTATPAGSSDYVAGGVSCMSATACIAVGNTLNDNSGKRTTVAERWNGHAWTIQRTANPATGGGLGGVSCTSAGACVAVGSMGPEGSSSGTLAERYG